MTTTINGEKAIAKLTLHGVGVMTKAERKAIASWLRTCAKALEKEGSRYSKRFTASYFGNLLQ